MSIGQLSEIESDLLYYLLDRLKSILSSAGCNDIPQEIVSRFPPEEWAFLNDQYHRFNGEPQEESSQPLPDHCYLSLICSKLRPA